MLPAVRSSGHAHLQLSTPVGKLTLIASEQALLAILWERERFNRVVCEPGAACPHHPLLLAASEQLLAYFRKERQIFDLPLAPQGTPFQQQVWQALLSIPYGQTRSYGELAAQLGRPGAARAVGAANGKNPLSIVIPCHRVIGSRGHLTGFGGGLDVKARLLALESAQQNLNLFECSPP